MILIFIRVQFKDGDFDIFAKKFRRIIAIIYLVAIAQFFEAIHTHIFNYLLLVVGFTKDRLFESVSTYFETMKINS